MEREIAGNEGMERGRIVDGKRTQLLVERKMIFSLRTKFEQYEK